MNKEQLIEKYNIELEEIALSRICDAKAGDDSFTMEYDSKYELLERFIQDLEGLSVSCPSDEEIGQTFRNNSDCYADTFKFDKISEKHIEGAVFQAMTEAKFIEVVIKWLRDSTPITEVRDEIETNHSKAKSILIDELNEQGHPENVEDVIFWALEYYCKNRRKGTWGETVAFAIKQRILDTESTPPKKGEKK